MPDRPETGFTPVLDPARPDTIPIGLRPRSRALAPLPPRLARFRRAGGAHRALSARLDLVGHFLYSDHDLERMERLDPLGVRAAQAAEVRACITMDTPLYGFMTPAQRERAWIRHLHRLHASFDAFPRVGIRPLPLVIGRDAHVWQGQFDLAHEAGSPGVAFYGRELLLEGGAEALRRFVRLAQRARLMPLLVGVFTPRALTWGRAELAARHHYVLARRGRLLTPGGRHRRVEGPEYSPLLRGWVGPAHVARLASHNFLQARRLLTPPGALDAFTATG